MHHGMVEHFSRQSTLRARADYVIDNWSATSRALAEAGLRLVFTGHFHAPTDEPSRHGTAATHTYLMWETGSLVTYPDPFRKVSINTDGEVKISSVFIESIEYDTGGLSFPDYSKASMIKGIETIAQSFLTELGVPAELIEQIKPAAVEAFLGHYKATKTRRSEPRASGATESITLIALCRFSADIYANYRMTCHQKTTTSHLAERVNKR